MQKTLAIAVLLVLVVVALTGDRGTSTVAARLGGETIVLEVADTNASHTRGLSGRERLAPGAGMLFVFSKDDRYGFWMKDMRFPIDIVWLDSEYRIVDVKESVLPSSYPEVFTPKSPSRYVLELPAGFFREHDLKVGDMLEILK